MRGQKKKNGRDELRDRAEEKLSQLSYPEELSPEEVQGLVHELRVHQLELEMQNDALREAQAELVESNSRFTDLYDFSPVGYLTLDEKSIIQEANLTLARMLQIERGTLIGRPFLSLITPHEKGVFRSNLARIFETRGKWTFETMLTAGGSARGLPVLLESLFVEDARGRKQCRISVTDISERKRAEQAAQIYLKRLERSNKELQEFAFIASHDLQEPLRKVHTFANIIKKKYAEALDEEGRDFLDRMMSSAIRMSEMIQGLLDYSRVGARENDFCSVDLARVVREVESDLEIMIQKDSARIEMGSLAVIEADPHQMRQLFQNLLSNALKFHGDKSPVIKIYSRPAVEELEKASGGKAYRIFVEDNGIGFSEQYLDRIFTLFQRLHSRSFYEGTGMGLAICRRIVERHHGSITARSEPGLGATFIITLPEKQPVAN